MDSNTEPPQVAASAKRYQIMLRDQGGQVTIDLADTVEHTGVTMDVADALEVADVIAEGVMRYIQQRVGGNIPLKLATLPIVEKILQQQAQQYENAAIRTPQPPVEDPDVEAWRGDRADLQWRVVKWHDRSCHAVADRRHLALQMVSEMAIFEDGAQRFSQGGPNHLVDCY